MNKLFAKVIAKRTIAFLLIVVLITTSMPAVAHAESPTNKEFYFYFTNVNSDSTKEALINNLYLYYADTGLTIPILSISSRARLAFSNLCSARSNFPSANRSSTSSNK